MAADVDDEAGELEASRADLRLRGALPSQLGIDAGGELAHLEGLGDVVVGSDLEPHDDVDNIARGRHHDDRYLDAGTAQPAAHVEAGEAGQGEVEQDQVDVGLLRNAQAVVAVLGKLDPESVLMRQHRENVAHRRIVVDDEHGRLGRGARRS